MDNVMVGVIGIVLLLVLLAIGLHIGLLMILIGTAGLVYIIGTAGGFSALGSTPYSVASTYSFIPLPLFFLMGGFAVSGGFGAKAYESASKWLGKLPGGLAIATTVASALFGMVSGSSMASAALFTKVSFSEMVSRGYNKKLAIAVIACAGTFATMIPPSGLLILYGLITEQSISDLFAAGIIPGFLTAAIYCILIYFKVRLNPKLAPKERQEYNLKEKLSSLVYVWPIIVLFVLVMGGIMTGIFTPTESAAVGAIGAFVIALALKGIRHLELKKAFNETMLNTGMIFLIFIGATLFGRFLTVSRLPTEFAAFLSGLPLPSLAILVMIIVMLFIMGMFLNSTSIIVITMPIFMPVLKALGYDLVWFGIIMIGMLEVGIVTPPVGMNIFVAQAASQGQV